MFFCFVDGITIIPNLLYKIDSTLCKNERVSDTPNDMPLTMTKWMPQANPCSALRYHDNGRTQRALPLYHHTCDCLWLLSPDTGTALHVYI